MNSARANLVPARIATAFGSQRIDRSTPVIPTRSSLFKRLCPTQKSIGKHGRGAALWVRDPLDVALRVYGLAVLISRQIDLQIYWLAAKYAGYFWERVTSHECLLWTVTSSLGPKAESRLINIDH